MVFLLIKFRAVEKKAGAKQIYDDHGNKVDTVYHVENARVVDDIIYPGYTDLTKKELIFTPAATAVQKIIDTEIPVMTRVQYWEIDDVRAYPKNNRTELVIYLKGTRENLIFVDNMRIQLYDKLQDVLPIVVNSD